MKKLGEVTEKFIQHVRESCEANKIKFTISNTKTIKYETFQLTGFFSDDDKELAVAGRHPEWVEILAHEYCHLIQWKTNSKYWTNCLDGDVDASSVVDSWLQGEDFEYDYIKNCLAKVRDLELDCERRAVKLIKKWKLPVSITDYKKKAFLYIHFHNCMLKNRKWVKKGYYMSKDKELLGAAYPNLDIKFTRTSSKIMKIFEKNAI